MRLMVVAAKASHIEGNTERVLSLRPCGPLSTAYVFARMEPSDLRIGCDQAHFSQSRCSPPRGDHMQAIVQDKYGSAEVLELKEIERPAIGDHDVLVRVRAAGVNPADWALMNGFPYIARPAPLYGLLKPRNPVRGTDVAGQVEAIGSGVTRFQPGDEVFGSSTGSYAEFAAAAEDTLALKPANLTFEQAATVPMAGTVALQAIRDHGKVGPGQQVLINGASGGIGTFAVQIAKALGAEVTAVASTRNMDLLRSIGADHVIDYTTADFTEQRRALRLHPRQRVEPLAVRAAARAHPDRDAHPERRQLRQPLVLQRGAARAGRRAVPLRRPAIGAVPRVDEPCRSGRPQGTDRGRQGHARPGSHLSAERCGAGDGPRRPGTCPGKGRDHRVTRQPSAPIQIDLRPSDPDLLSIAKEMK